MEWHPIWDWDSGLKSAQSRLNIIKSIYPIKGFEWLSPPGILLTIDKTTQKLPSAFRK